MHGLEGGRARRAGWLLVCCALALGACGGGDDDGGDQPSGGAGTRGGESDGGAPAGPDGGAAGSAAGAGGDDAGSVPTGRLTEPLPPGEPIDAPDGEWTWVDFPGTRCMNDSATGLGIKLVSSSNDVLIVIQGGGACFNATTCLAAVNPNGFAAAALPAATNVGLLDAADPDNPFAGWNHVFIPYCSGDIFSGNALDGTGYMGRTQAGYHNIREYLTRLQPTFPKPARIVLSGYSAGGFAATVNWIQAIEAWPGVRVDVLNDSGPPMGAEYLSPCLQKRLAEVWNWGVAIPEDCTDCDVATGNVTEPVLRWAAPHTSMYRHALVSSTEDAIIKLFFAFGLNDCASIDALFASYPQGLYPQGLQDLQNGVFGDNPNNQAFLVGGTQHVWTTQSPGTVVSEGVKLSDWLSDFLDPEADWQTVSPLAP